MQHVQMMQCCIISCEKYDLIVYCDLIIMFTMLTRQPDFAWFDYTQFFNTFLLQVTALSGASVQHCSILLKCIVAYKCIIYTYHAYGTIVLKTLDYMYMLFETMDNLIIVDIRWKVAEVNTEKAQ